MLAIGTCHLIELVSFSNTWNALKTLLVVMLNSNLNFRQATGTIKNNHPDGI